MYICINTEAPLTHLCLMRNLFGKAVLAGTERIHFHSYFYVPDAPTHREAFTGYGHRGVPFGRDEPKEC